MTMNKRTDDTPEGARLNERNLTDAIFTQESKAFKECLWSEDDPRYCVLHEQHCVEVAVAQAASRKAYDAGRKDALAWARAQVKTLKVAETIWMDADPGWLTALDAVLEKLKEEGT